MQLIDSKKVQEIIDSFANQNVYIHLETTNGAYATHKDASFFNASAFIRNAMIQFERGKIAGDGPYRIGLKLPSGWVYGEGLTHFELDEQNRLIMAGLDHSGKLAIAFELSKTPF
ncbi:YojF family protein [Bacillus kwashiorkori]|uniref:YojF family protein n=1 Tax=Bacillus kwashiorkori TaxID=1522318 RepID=UPI000785B22D|nr:YojF family protein [Bacillus kwashiorkori]